ncbi:four helix bundle protein [Carboxylicivirga caseinilyticus]|uniref:four helix bundle protein n=1 Tax=Carboxylicivirga caseinilyticus TaxID=3417572 RepID=UPI003D325E09|nr:four helix bundle protein [Marinilabiliaceae bacterium A049]
MGKIDSFKDLIVYQKAYNLAMDIFEISKSFPYEEKYSLTDQIRRSSRSITANLTEAWAKRRYEKVFINKLSDCLGEEHETEVWLDYAKDCQYINKETHEKIVSNYLEVRKILISMINCPEKWCPSLKQ